MQTETVLGRIIAAVLLLSDKLQQCFVSVQMADGSFNCNATNCGSSAYYTGFLTECGRYVLHLQAIVEALQDDLVHHILPGLGIV